MDDAGPARRRSPPRSSTLFYARFDPRAEAETARRRRRRAIRAEIEAALAGSHEPRRGPHPAPLRQPRRSGGAHELLPARHGRPAAPDASPFKFEMRDASKGCRCRGRSTRSSSIRRASRACICASARWRAAACAGPTGRRISAPRCWASSRRSRSRTPSSCRSAPRAASCPSACRRATDRQAWLAEGVAAYQDLRRHAARPHRQHRRRRTSCRRPTPCGTTATIPISWSPPTRARRPSPTSPTRSRSSTSHWLGDAFASGGRQGYDHKKMGITARGAWEAVKRHFREMDVDIQTNAVHGRRRRRHVRRRVRQRHAAVARDPKLVAAFDHRDIFLDPDPDPAASLRRARSACSTCRARAGRTTTRRLISKGGGVFPRSAKSDPALARSAGAARPRRRRRRRPPRS